MHEAVEAFGPGAEIAARIADQVLYELDGPIARFGALPSPVPYSPALEKSMLPDPRVDRRADPRGRRRVSGGAAVLYEPDLPCPAPDGTVLATDVYRPAAGGRHPAVLQRTPYDKRQHPLTWPLLDPRKLAAAGYVVAIQDVRGRFGSGGEFVPYLHEAADGVAAVEWLSRQPVLRRRRGDVRHVLHGRRRSGSPPPRSRRPCARSRRPRRPSTSTPTTSTAAARSRSGCC